MSRGSCCDLFVAALLYNHSSAAVVTRILELLHGPFVYKGEACGGNNGLLL